MANLTVNPQARVKQRVIEHVREAIRAGKLKCCQPNYDRVPFLN